MVCDQIRSEQSALRVSYVEGAAIACELYCNCVSRGYCHITPLASILLQTT
jgi:hypothetical protein